MKKWIIALLILGCMCLSGCSKEDDVTSLSEYDMVYLDEKKDCHNLFI